VLLDKEFNIKIADFGFSNLYDPDKKLETFCGSPPYAAPELFQGKAYVGPEVDIWSLGVVLYVLTTGDLPFNARNLMEMKQVVCRGKFRTPSHLSMPLANLLAKMLVTDPTKRASLKVLVDDPWINSGKAS
jgi:MAP/microtubule affinity-regulating kinase